MTGARPYARRAAAVLAAAALAAAVLLIAFAAACARRGPDRFVATADGVRIAYHIEGKGRPALVFVHGWSCDRTYWRNQIAAFAPTHAVVTVDLAGHGESGADRTEWSIPAFGADVAAVVKREKLRRVVLVGHSMGGEVCLEAARLLPDRVLGIIGVDTFQDLGAVMSPDEIAQYLAPFRADFKAAAGFFVRAMFPWGTNPDLVESIVRDMSSAPPQVALAVFEALFAYVPARALRDVRVPIRVINSDRIPTNVEGNRKLAASFEIQIMAGRGHFPQLEDSAGFNRLLEQTIAELSARR
ncbi:MAG: alpha/beta hydrolase [Candidatus Aminicenantes bacterium]|nr:alpha/beta hydrolase [Candidatus Aminicenantes bacterium]